MKSMVILVLGCLPLGVLTVWSFVEIGAIDEQLGSPCTTRNPEAEAGLAVKVGAQVSREKPVVAGLADVDLLSGEALPGLDAVTEESSFNAVKDTWPQWTAARRMVAEFLQTERLAAAAAPRQVEQIPLEQLDRANRQLEDLKRQYEGLKQKYEKLKQDYQNSPARETARFLTLVDLRIADMDRRIDECKKRLEAAALLSDARAAFQPQKYGQCAGLCDKLLSGYSAVLDSSVVEKVSVLRQRAQFWADAERLSSELKEADALARREAILEDFLNKHNDGISRTRAEQRILEQCEEDLRDVTAQIEAQKANQAAQELIRRLNQDLPAAFDDRLRSTAQIVDAYPTETVKMTLRGNARQWLQEFLPEHEIAESPGLKEAETTRHEIVRGFFADVKAPDGTLFGYKRYPTPEALADPAFDVGTYRKEEFLVPPGESTPRRCVRQYNEARNRLLESPSRRAAWVELAALCESLEAELRDYRKKKGASREDPELSFEREGRFVREFLAGSGWAHVETLFGP